MPAETIVAQPGTLTGSIGIYGGKIVIGGTLGKAGVSTETVTSGANADIYSPFAPFTPAQRAKVESYMEGFYKNFLAKVADSRKSTPDAIHPVAQGRVWTGRQALEHGLVDALGGLDTAIAMAKERAKIPANEDVQLVVYPERRSLFDALSEQFGSAGSTGVWTMLAGSSERRAAAALSAPTRLFRRGEPLALMPFTFVR
jgi:protease-4